MMMHGMWCHKLPSGGGGDGVVPGGLGGAAGSAYTQLSDLCLCISLTAVAASHRDLFPSQSFQHW